MERQVHHLNCGTLRPVLGAWLMPGASGRFMPCHCLLVSHGGGWVLVDGGIGLQDLASPARRLGSGFCRTLRPALREDETALRQVAARGLDPRRVTDIVITHLDMDHVGAVADFPWARVHVAEAELRAAGAAATRVERSRYRREQWGETDRWELYDGGGEAWLADLRAQPLRGLDGLLLVPLPGHTRGHSGVAVPQPGGRWLLHAGDAYTVSQELAPRPRWSFGLWAYHRTHVAEPAAWRHSFAAVRYLAMEERRVTVFGSHDADAFAVLEHTGWREWPVRAGSG